MYFDRTMKEEGPALSRASPSFPLTGTSESQRLLERTQENLSLGEGAARAINFSEMGTRSFKPF
jgi:hypothetical protein